MCQPSRSALLALLVAGGLLGGLLQPRQCTSGAAVGSPPASGPAGGKAWPTEDASGALEGRAPALAVSARAATTRQPSTLG